MVRHQERGRAHRAESTLRLGSIGSRALRGQGCRLLDAGNLLLIGAVCLGGCEQRPPNVKSDHQIAKTSRESTVQHYKNRSSQQETGEGEESQHRGKAPQPLVASPPHRDTVPNPLHEQADSRPDTQQPVFRAPDTRPDHDERQLARFGIDRYASKRLELFTDVPPDVAEPLPQIIDQAYAAWERYFGPLPSNRTRTDYQLTGYLMADQELFRRAGLLRDDLSEFRHGHHRGTEFWMNDQQTDYYRRHLMIHEATHCFMTATRDEQNLPPKWYMEGMAELFGTHRLQPVGPGRRTGPQITNRVRSATKVPPGRRDPQPNGRIRFRVMPEDKDSFVGFGRIALVRQDIESGHGRTLSAMFRLTSEDFVETKGYAWSWALCKFLDTHPRYRDRFRQLGACSTGTDFVEQFRRHFEPEFPDLRTEWQLFAANLEYGYDIQRTVIDFQPGKPLNEMTEQQAVVEVSANRGWQSSGVLLKKGREYEVTARGQFTLANDPKPWVSEPQGVSFLYFKGDPLGRLMGTIRRAPPFEESERTSMLDVLSLGRKRHFNAPYSGTLYLRLNDYFSRLADNQGTVRVRLRRVKQDSAPYGPPVP